MAGLSSADYALTPMSTMPDSAWVCEVDRKNLIACDSGGVNRYLWLAIAVVPVLGCSPADEPTDDPAGGALPTLTDWCDLYEEPLPALASPNPDGRELEVLDVYVARYTVLATGAPGVPAETSSAIDAFVSEVVDVRGRVESGEELADVLALAASDQQAGLWAAGALVEEQVATLCK